MEEKKEEAIQEELDKAMENKDNQNLEKEKEDKTKQELEEMTDRYKRLMAEFDNFKKRSAKERESLYDSLTSEIGRASCRERVSASV